MTDSTKRAEDLANQRSAASIVEGADVTPVTENTPETPLPDSSLDMPAATPAPATTNTGTTPAPATTNTGTTPEATPAPATTNTGTTPAPATTNTGTAPATTPATTEKIFDPTKKEIDSVRHLNTKERTDRLTAKTSETQAIVNKGNSEGKPVGVQVYTADGKPSERTIFMPKGQTQTKGRSGGEKAPNKTQEGIETTKDANAEKPKEKSWWERNSTWIWWTLSGLGLAAIGILGFRKGGLFNKRKSSKTDPSTPTPTPKPGGGNDLGDYLKPDNGDGPSSDNSGNNNTLAGAGTQLKDTTLGDLSAEQKSNWINNYRQNG